MNPTSFSSIVMLKVSHLKHENGKSLLRLSDKQHHPPFV